MDEEKKNNTSASPQGGSINVTIEPSPPKGFTPKLSALQDKAMNLSRMSEQGIINEKTGAAVVIRDDGQINLTPGVYSQYKLSPHGRATEISMESVTTTNRKRFHTNDFIINEHKLNPQLWEYTDFRVSKLLTNQRAIVGNLNMMGSVLVKAWEPNLKRYVMIRRPWMGPVFGSTMNVADINPALGINDPLKLNEDILALSSKGYQVNGAIRDAKSLIGKQGKDRDGIIRNSDALTGNGEMGSSTPGAAANPANVGKAPGKGVENIPSSAKPWSVEMCKRCSEKCGIPADWIWAQFCNESGDFESPCAQHNYGGMSSEGGGWMTFGSTDEFADYMAKVLPRWVGSDGKATTDAKTMREYAIALQTDTSPYCADPAGVEPYYNAMLRCLGNQGTVL